MKTGKRGLDLIKKSEGLRLDAYADPGHGWKVPTIGYGHTSMAGPPKVVKGMRITAQEAEDILKQDLGKFEQYVEDYITVPLNQNQFDALVSFTFNVGPGNLRRSTLRKKLNLGDYSGASGEFGKWVRSKGRVLRGLVIRRAAESRLFLSETGLPTVWRILRRGSKGEDVKVLQAKLGGIDGIKYVSYIAVDGDFGPITERTVIKFQEDNNLLVDGVVGPQTRRALGLEN